MSTGVLLMLEDDSDRLVRFREVVPRLGLQLVVWRSARRMIAELGEHLPLARLISLDHDLELEGAEDPGDGLDVAKHLAALGPACPVVIHTSNGARGDAMQGELELAGWRFARVLPLGDDWVEVDWVRAARRLLRGRPRPA